MRKPGIRQQVKRVVLDQSLTVEERTDRIFQIRNDFDEREPDKHLQNDVIIFSALAEMVEKENGGEHAYNEELLQIYVLLGETYEALRDFRPVRDLAIRVLRVLTDCNATARDVKHTVPRLVEVIQRTVYMHFLYEILLRYLRIMLVDSSTRCNVKEEITLMLKLRILLDEHGWCEELFDTRLRDAISRRVTKSELMEIIRHPDLGLLKVDPVEYSWEWEHIFYDLEDELNTLFINEPRHMGFCFRLWSARQEILKNKYAIDWKSPGQMNPRVIFD